MCECVCLDGGMENFQPEKYLTNKWFSQPAQALVCVYVCVSACVLKPVFISPEYFDVYKMNNL